MPEEQEQRQVQEAGGRSRRQEQEAGALVVAGD